MRYWGYLAAKLSAAALFLWALRAAILYAVPRPAPVEEMAFRQELNYTASMMLLFLVSAGTIWAVLWDQKYRCRTCLHRLMMPLAKGSWNHVLLGPPRTEYICPFGHGTLKVEELQITGHQEPAWTEHEDMWTELVALEDAAKK